MDAVLSQVISGLGRASFLYLIVIGLTLIFSVLGVLNVAHVSFYMLGAYFTVMFWGIFQDLSFSYWLSIPLVCLTMAAIGLLTERVLVRHLYSRIMAEQCVVTFALIYIFIDIAKLAWGIRMYSIPTQDLLLKPLVKIGAVSFPVSAAFTIGVAILVAFALWGFLGKTKYGNIVRAAQSDREMVAALGIPTPLIYSLVFSLSALLAGLGGAVWLASGVVEPYKLDLPMLPQVFCIMIIGGMGSLWGTAVASLLVGEVFALSILISPKAGMFAIFVITGLVLIIRPWGLFGAKERIE
jgi:branched-subunit amino acid ABC-type transport system permease component